MIQLYHQMSGPAARRRDMLAPKAEVGSWVSEAAREKFMAAYERAFALWPQPREEFDIETATTTTRVHACRPHPGGAPVVLLTGAGFNATTWPTVGTGASERIGGPSGQAANLSRAGRSHFRRAHPDAGHHHPASPTRHARPA